MPKKIQIVLDRNSQICYVFFRRLKTKTINEMKNHPPSTDSQRPHQPLRLRQRANSAVVSSGKTGSSRTPNRVSQSRHKKQENEKKTAPPSSQIDQGGPVQIGKTCFVCKLWAVSLQSKDRPKIIRKETIYTPIEFAVGDSVRFEGAWWIILSLSPEDINKDRSVAPTLILDPDLFGFKFKKDR